MNKITPGTRLGTMLLDHLIMTMVIMIFVAPGMISDMLRTFDDADIQPKLFYGNIYLNIFAFSLYFNKDIYLGRSPAKRILKLQVVDVKTDMPASPIKCLIRNVTIILWPIEVIASLVNNERRIGDYLAGTKPTAYNPLLHKDEINWTSVAIALIASMLVCYLLMAFPVQLMVGESGALPTG